MSKNPEQKADKKKRKDKGKGKRKDPLSTFYAKDSDDEQATAQPSGLVPPGSVLLTDVVDSEEFDYDTLKNNDNLELCIVRVPGGVKPKFLADAQISLPSSSAPSLIVGTLPRKTTTYDIWSIRGDSSDQNTIAGGDEILGLSCLVPRKKKDGKLFVAPKPVARHFVLTAQAALPTPPPSSPDAPNAITYKSPARYQHPKHLLKHRFLPPGTRLEPSGAENDVEMTDADQTSQTQIIKNAPLKPDSGVVEGGSPKKRKVDDESKKVKKVKTGS